MAAFLIATHSETESLLAERQVGQFGRPVRPPNALCIDGVYEEGELSGYGVNRELLKKRAVGFPLESHEQAALLGPRRTKG